MAISRAHVKISGYVQGVSFRYYTQVMANQLGLKGWVRNLWDGGVEAVFEGEEEAVDKMVGWCHDGPLMARVENVKVDIETPTGEFSHFSIHG
jgi:acylphosphatase